MRDLPESDLPRAELAVDLSQVTRVNIKTPALLADKDPYNSAKPTLKVQPEPEKETTGDANTDNQPKPGATPQKEEQIEIRKAIPVGPSEDDLDKALLKSQTPPPEDVDPDE